MNAEARACGDCQACCTALQVHSLRKGDWERCKHQGPLGCRIYSRRPDDCAGYACLWLQGLGDRDWRPDRLGVVLSIVDSERWGHHLMVHELRPGALAQPEVARRIERLMQDYPAFSITPAGMRKLLGGPEAVVLQLMETAREHGVLTIEGAPPDVPLEALLRRSAPR